MTTPYIVVFPQPLPQPHPPTPPISPDEHNSCLLDLPGFPPGQKADQLME